MIDYKGHIKYVLYPNCWTKILTVGVLLCRYKEYDIHFIFDDDIIKLSFYTVPQVDVFAIDSEGGLIGTIGSFTDLQSDFPICYINKNKECFLIANSGKEFLETPKNWKNNLKPCNEVIFYESKLEAEKELRFINI